jgi:anti-anti-sigma factor
MSAGIGSGSTLSVGVEDCADCRIVSVAGRVDHTNSTEFLEVLARHAGEKDGSRGMVVDLSGLEFITSAGLRALLMAHRTLADAGGRLIVTGLNGVVKEVFRISKFDSLLTVVEGAAEAVERISRSGGAAGPG